MEDEVDQKNSYHLNYFVVPKFWLIWQFIFLFFCSKNYVDAPIKIDQFHPFSSDVDWKYIKLDYKGIDLKEWLLESVSGCFHLMIIDGNSRIDPTKYIRIQFYNQTDLMAFKLIMS